MLEGTLSGKYRANDFDALPFQQGQQFLICQVKQQNFVDKRTIEMSLTFIFSGTPFCEKGS